MAAPYTVNSGTLLSTNDVVSLAISGSDYATVRVVVSVAGSGGITFQYSLDGLNWLSSAYAKRLDQVSANPSVATWVNNTPVAGIYEVPLPGNCTNFRVLYQTGGTATTLSITGGAQVIPGVPIIAVLYDVTSGVNALLDTGVVDVSGWNTVGFSYAAGAAGSMAPKWVDDGGTAMSSLISAITGVSAVGSFGPGCSGTNSLTFLPKRIQFISQPIVGQTSRVRIEAHR